MITNFSNLQNQCFWKSKHTMKFDNFDNINSHDEFYITDINIKKNNNVDITMREIREVKNGN
jgi:hypothetical protein